MLCTCRNLTTGSPLSFLFISHNRRSAGRGDLWCCNSSSCLLCLCHSPAPSSHECRVSFIVVNTRINHVCSAWNTFFFTCNEQSVKQYDVLKSRPASVHLISGMFIPPGEFTGCFSLLTSPLRKKQTESPRL